MSKIYFMCTLYYAMNQKQIKRLQKIQNYAARIITLSNKYTHITPILNYLNWLPIKEFIQYRYLTIIHKCLQNTAPRYLCDLLEHYEPGRQLRSNNMRLLKVPNIKTKFGQRSFYYSAPKLWNALPHQLRFENSQEIFKNKLKEYLLYHINM